MVENDVDKYNSSVEKENKLLKKIEKLRVEIIECKDNIKTAKLVEKLSLIVAGLSMLGTAWVVLGNYSVGYLVASFAFFGISMNCATAALVIENEGKNIIVKNEQIIEETANEVEKVRLVREYTEQLSNQLSFDNDVSLNHLDSKTSSKGKAKVRNINDDK